MKYLADVGIQHRRFIIERLTVDGVDIAKSTNGYRLEAKPGCVPRLILDLAVHDTTTLSSPYVEVLIGEEAVAVLERAGWTPPPGTASVLRRNADGCPCDWIDIAGDPAEPQRALRRIVPTCPVHGSIGEGKP